MKGFRIPDWFCFVLRQNYLFTVHTNTYTGKIPKTVKYWVGLVKPDQSVKIQPEEVLDSVWLPLDKASAHITYASAKQLLQEVIEAIQANKLVDVDPDLD